CEHRVAPADLARLPGAELRDDSIALPDVARANRIQLGDDRVARDDGLLPLLDDRIARSERVRVVGRQPLARADQRRDLTPEIRNEWRVGGVALGGPAIAGHRLGPIARPSGP